MWFGICLLAIVSTASLFHYYLTLGNEYPVPHLIGAGTVILTVTLAAGIVHYGGGYVHSILLGTIPGIMLGSWSVFVAGRPMHVLLILGLIAGFAVGTIGYVLGTLVTHRRVTRVTLLLVLLGAVATVATIKLCFGIGMCGGGIEPA